MGKKSQKKKFVSLEEYEQKKKCPLVEENTGTETQRNAGREAVSGISPETERRENASSWRKLDEKKEIINEGMAEQFNSWRNPKKSPERRERFRNYKPTNQEELSWRIRK